MGRIIIFTGKGGVGKSSTAAAHAVKAAAEGRRTLIVSTDMAHNLSDIFGVKLGEEPSAVLENLDALEIDPNYEMSRHYGSISAAIKGMLPSGENGIDAAAMEDMVVFPGIEELFALIRIRELYDSGSYDLIIVDCAPTGETLSLLKFPELMSWYMEKLFPIGKAAMKVMRPIAKSMFKLEMPDNKAMNDIERLYVELGRLQSLLRDRSVCSIRIVAIPEKMVVEESKRSYMYLNLFNFNVDGLYINRVLPEESENEFFSEWRTLQGRYIEELNSAFGHLPLYTIKWYETDINGLDGLRRIGDDSLGDKALFDVRCETSGEVYEKCDGGYTLTVRTPFADKSAFELYETGTDIVIKAGCFKRCIPLPNVLHNSSVTAAEMNGGRLVLTLRRQT